MKRKEVILKITDGYNLDLEPLVKDILINDYYMLNDDISNFYEQNENVEMQDVSEHYLKDLSDNILYRDSLEILLKFYLTEEEYKEKVLEENGD